MSKKQLNPLYIIFSITTFLSAALLFQLEPIIGKYLLPRFGGTAFVWITALLFFQILLLLGYLYSYLLTKLSPLLQTIIHTLLLLANLLLFLTLFFHKSIPIMPQALHLLPTEIFSPTILPLLQVLTLLTISIGLPFFLLSTTSTLLQKWFGLAQKNKSPYSLYALSNAGSLLGVLTYPFLIEPFLPLSMQGSIWSIFFLSFCALYTICIFLRHKTSPNPNLKKSSASNTLVIPAKAGIQLHQSIKTKIPPTSNIKIPNKKLIPWLLLPAISSLLLLAATSEMTQAISPAPFLWLLPLSLYLISFIITFVNKPFYLSHLTAYCFLFTCLITISLLLTNAHLGFFPTTFLYTVLLSSAFLLCHAELYRRKPDIHHLNLFYLCISFGSILGSIIVAIIAPLFFIGLFWEFYLAIFTTFLLATYVLLQNPTSLLSKIISSRPYTQKHKYSLILITVCIIFFLFFYANYKQQNNSSLGIWRNFYATLRITYQETNNNNLLCLANGLIIHGCQYQKPPLSQKPTTYYSTQSGVGLAIQSLRNTPEVKTNGLHMGVIGLGIGTLANYGQKNDHIHFYELNPQSITIAQEKFTNLQNSPAKITITEGDGRLSLEKQTKLPSFDLLVIDAFSDDAIPTHLLTKEAFDLYLKHLTPNGILAIHISNKYLDLTPVIKKLADHYNLHLTITFIKQKTGETLPSQWALLSRNKKLINTSKIQQTKQPLPQKNIPLWTDDYSNLLQILKY